MANKTLVWGYRFNGTATGTQMFNAIVAADPRLYAVETVDPDLWHRCLNAIGYQSATAPVWPASPTGR